MKGVPSKVVQHTIPIRDDAKPVQRRPYDMNPKYETIVKEEIDKLRMQDSFMKSSTQNGYPPS